MDARASVTSAKTGQPSTPPRPLREALIAFAVATAAAAICFQLARFVPFIADNLSAFVAAGFLYIPVAIAWRAHEDLREHGLTLRPLGRSIAFALAVPAVVFPLFVLAFDLFYGNACSPSAQSADAVHAPGAVCARFTGLAGLLHPHPPLDFLSSAFSQIVVVALPEELFFRGYLLHRLEQAWPPARRILGGGVGKALVVSAVLFALGHVLVNGDPRRLAVFFPGLLFGWMRSATGSIASGIAVHAESNLFIEALQRTFFA